MTNQTRQFKLAVMAPCNAKLQTLDSHPLELIQAGILGPGVCFEPLGSQIFSPISGEVIFLPETCHQVRIKHPSGVVIHIEFGINTQTLMAHSFKRYVTANQVVKQGQLLFDYNLPLLNQTLDSTMCFMGITNLTENYQFSAFYHSVTAKQDTAFVIKTKV